METLTVNELISQLQQKIAENIEIAKYKIKLGIAIEEGGDITEDDLRAVSVDNHSKIVDLFN